MCTAISLTDKDHYFGRNLDYHYSFSEKIIITPRKYPLFFRNGTEIEEHYSIIGMGLVCDDYPLYFDATNEKGLSMAGLYFPDNALYMQKNEDKTNVASFELILWILSQCEDVCAAENKLKNINITNEKFKNDMKPSPLHWIISDKNKSITLEQTQKGLLIYENKVGVLTNNPAFDMQIFYLNNFMSLSTEEPKNSFSEKICLKTYTKGMGAIGLPGDLSSMSRFVKASFTKLNSQPCETEVERVHQFFHILYSVYQQKGCVKVGEKFEITHYTSCCNTTNGIYYYTTYNNSTINFVDMHKSDLNSSSLITYELKKIVN